MLAGVSLAFVGLCRTLAARTPRLPVVLWPVVSGRSLRVASRNALGLSSRRPVARWAASASGSARLYLGAGLGLPVIAAASLAAAGKPTLIEFSRETIGTLWQVEGALIGLAIALAIYGFESLARSGPIEPAELATLWLPRALYLGLALVATTGIAYFSFPDPNSTPAVSTLSNWLAIGSIGVASVWLVVLLRALPEAVRVADPGFRTVLRLARVRPLALDAVERRLVELAAANLLVRLAARFGSSSVPWISLDGTEGENKIVRSDRNGYLWDVDLKGLASVLSNTPALAFTLRVERRISMGQVVGIAAANVSRSTTTRLNRALDLRASPATEPLTQLIGSLRDSAKDDLASRPQRLSDVLDAYSTCLEVFATEWERHVGRMETNQLREPLMPDRTPLGLVLDSVTELMTDAIRRESREAVSALGYFPSRIARIGLEHSSTAYLTSLELSTRFYALGVSMSQSSQAENAKRSWTFVAELIQWILPSARRGYTGPANPELVREAEIAARRTLIATGREMLRARDLAQFKALGERLAMIRDD